MAMAMSISERMELQRAALAGARRRGAGARSLECARAALELLDADLERVPVGRRLAWVTRVAGEQALRRRQPVFDADARRAPATADWLDEALHPLEPPLRRVLELTYGEGLTAVEIGRLLGCSVEAVTELRGRGRQRLTSAAGRPAARS